MLPADIGVDTGGGRRKDRYQYIIVDTCMGEG